MNQLLMPEMKYAEPAQLFQPVKTFVLSTLALRCLELIKKDYTIFSDGWNTAITELVNAEKIKIYKIDESYTTIIKITKNIGITTTSFRR